MNQTAEAQVRIDGVVQRFGHDVVALRGISLDVLTGEFITLLGPSGCGKTTLLRVIAGFETPDEGRIVLEGRDVTRTPAHRRPVNMVFQRPLLFPHLDVFENVAFGLRVARTDRAEVERRVAETLRLVRLEGFERRRSHELSGGQMQRIALGRALVNRPRVLLLDEPLSALDLAIRLELEAELRRVHRETGATFVYVTHDQREALALSDRIALLNDGRLEQVASPHEIYHAPTSPFAARFVGDANVLPVDVVARGQELTVLLAGAEVPTATPAGISSGPAWLVLRPEAISVSAALDAPGVDGTIVDAAFRGTGFNYRVRVAGVEELIKAEPPGRASVPLGSAVRLSWRASDGALLPRARAE